MAVKISNREKYFLVAAGGFIILFALVQLVVSPMLENRQRLERALQVKTSMLEELTVLTGRFDSIRTETDRVKSRFENRKEGFTLFSFLDRLAGEVAVKSQIVYMKPSRTDIKKSPYKLSSVEMKLQGVTLDKLMSYLYRIETSPNMVRIRRISISREGKQNQMLTAVLQAESVET